MIINPTEEEHYKTQENHQNIKIEDEQTKTSNYDSVKTTFREI